MYGPGYSLFIKIDSIQQNSKLFDDHKLSFFFLLIRIVISRFHIATQNWFDLGKSRSVSFIHEAPVLIMASKYSISLYLIQYLFSSFSLVSFLPFLTILSSSLLLKLIYFNQRLITCNNVVVFKYNWYESAMVYVYPPPAFLKTLIVIFL